MCKGCPNCGGRLFLNRTDDVNVVEYEASCLSCRWTGSLRQLRCGGCHRQRLFLWTGEKWRCIQCGHVKESSPPRSVARR